jgi:hypothetical protein
MAKAPKTRAGSNHNDEHELRLAKITRDIDRALHAAGLSGPARQQYRGAAQGVVSKMTPGALERFSRNVRGYKFYASHEDLTAAYKSKYPRAKIKTITAAFDPKGVLHLDGGGVLFSRQAPLAEFYAHEATHAIDGTDHASRCGRFCPGV